MVQPDYLHRARIWLVIFVCGLVVSGVTAFPLQSELGGLVSILHMRPVHAIAESTGLLAWIERVNEGVCVMNASYPFLAYGTDWLAFAHLVIAILFIGPYIDPVRNKWVITFGLIACGAVVPLALIAGQYREIPIGWRLLDCSFGVFGSVPLLRCRWLVFKLEQTMCPKANVRDSL